MNFNIDRSMAALIPPPPVKKSPNTAFPQRRGKVKAQIFGGIADSVVSAASRAGVFIGLIKKGDTSAPATPPITTNTFGD